MKSLAEPLANVVNRSSLISMLFSLSKDHSGLPPSPRGVVMAISGGDSAGLLSFGESFMTSMIMQPYGRIRVLIFDRQTKWRISLLILRINISSMCQ